MGVEAGVFEGEGRGFTNSRRRESISFSLGRRGYGQRDWEGGVAKITWRAFCLVRST